MGRYTIKKYTTRLMAVLLVLGLLASMAPAVYADGESGSCGGGLSWNLSAGTLTITGSGAMTDFPESTMAPWYDCRDEIIRLELPSGLTSIGSLAFYGCKNLTTVVIPGSVTKIGSYAFAKCESLELLNLGGSVRSIDEAAFSDCVSLTALSLPGTLTTIGMKAFYRCESITTVTVPSSVTSLGISAFAYCKRLVSANIQAPIKTIPEFLFYGCERLTSVTLPDDTSTISEFAFRGCSGLDTVYYGGSSKTLSEIQDSIGEDVPGFSSTGFVSDSSASESVISGTTQDNGNGTYTQENVTVTEKENVSVSTSVEVTRQENGTAESISTSITVTVNGSDGWEDAQKNVEDALDSIQTTASKTGVETGEVAVNVYVQGTDSIDPDFLNALAGREVRLTVMTQDGSVWRIDSSLMDSENLSGSYDLSYTLEAGSEELNDELGTLSSFVLRFQASAEVNAEVLIRLGVGYTQQEATLFQRNGELIRVQTVAVDKDGYAHFYLASVNKNTDYYIAMNLLDGAQELIVPEEMLADYGIVENYAPIEYEITGRTSSWGMTFSQVTWILIGVLVACVVVVGFVMFTLNKRKLKMGYVPELDEEDYQQ